LDWTARQAVRRPAASRSRTHCGLKRPLPIVSLERRPMTPSIKPAARPAFRWALISTLISASYLSTHAAESPASAPTNHATFARIEITDVHNAFQVTDRVYSGSQPEGDEAFAALAKLGVKTIISVDGSKPDVEAARKHGLRYIHLPFGYDGVSTNRIVELAKAAATLPGPFFVHCHHGLHRGPTAVAIICESTAGWTTNRAAAWMRQAGAAADYAGLYRSAITMQMPTVAQLDAIKDLPEVAKTSALVEAMVAIDAHFSVLKQSQKAGWKTPRGHPNDAPRHEATLLWEQFRELARTEDTTKRTDDFRAKLTDAEQATDSLRQRLREPMDAIAVDAAFKKAGRKCAACHAKYRNE
jgi:protein tyrosine phosphatase (PTP) superfamily phosphohydrolase (DUF442 family)